VTRTVTLILVDAAGNVLGALPPFVAATPWWQDVSEFPDGITVLRLLHADRPAMPGGHVTYLAETSSPPPGLTPVDLTIEDQPRRFPYAVPGGPQASLTWAYGVLGRSLPAKQMRTWNLSSIWRLGDGSFWLKQVPPFLAHEPAAIRLVDAVAPGLVPPLIAAGEQGRMLLAHVPGEDRYGAGADVCSAIAAAFHPVQAHFATHLDDLAAIPDARRTDYARVAAPYYDAVPGLRDVIAGLPDRLAALAACGLPDTLVHGDLHPGNARTGDAGPSDPLVRGDLHPGNARTGDAGRVTILDWGDCSIGNPALDIVRLTEHLPDPAPLLDAWAARWRATIPGCDPHRALDLIRPVAALRGAAVYQHFLDNIEPSERPYHAADVPDCLVAAARLW
jgi:hypothetical protein